MGVEYKFHVSGPDARKLDDILRKGPFFSDFDPDYRFYNFRTTPHSDRAIMPALAAAIERDGLYVCDNCAGPDVVVPFLDYLKASLEGEFGQVRIEEL